MTDDDRDIFEPEATPDDAGDPAAAFEALRGTVEDLAANLTREMTTIHKGVEATFEEFERFQQPPTTTRSWTASFSRHLRPFWQKGDTVTIFVSLASLFLYFGLSPG